MVLKVKTREGKLLGTLSFPESNQVQFIDKPDKEFANFVKQAQEQGITQLRDIYDEQTKTFSLVEGPIGQGDKNYPLAFREFLERHGYQVEELHLEIEAEITRLLADFPDNNQDKIDMLRRLPDMSYLEQTFILEELKKLPSGT